QYYEYMLEKPLGEGGSMNPYYESLLVNLPNPAPNAKDPRSRAICHADENFEYFYEIKHIDSINQML
ncbi:hypothetical protein K469DRAFT_470503, partial [Zopfia rhizophila CBS 207.26]